MGIIGPGFISQKASFGSGTSQTVFTPDPGFQQISMARGTNGEPDENWSPLFHASRTLSITEASFTGDGAPGLASIYAVTKATSTSQGQSVGIYGGGITDGTYAGAGAQSDAVGGYFVGRSSATSTRVGIGIFANGRRENEAGLATGAEIVSDNETAKAGVVNLKGFSDTKGIWLHAAGTADSAVGLQIGKPTTAKFAVGIGINEGAATTAIAVAEGGGGIVIGAASPTAGVLLEVTDKASHDPIAQFTVTAAAPMSLGLVKNPSGNAKAFVSNAAEQFVKGSVQGDTGISFTPGKTFHIGAQEKTSMLRIGEGTMGFFGHAPAAQPAKPAESFAAIIAALEGIGIFA